MQENGTKLLPKDYNDSAPLEFSNFTPDTVTTDDVVECAFSLRIKMIQNLSQIAENMTKTISTTTDIQSQILLSTHLRKLYTDINRLTKAVEASTKAQMAKRAEDGLEFSRGFSPFLNFNARKSRSLIWLDYSAWCKNTETPKAGKSVFFRALEDHGFRRSITRGSVTLVPPGVR